MIEADSISLELLGGRACACVAPNEEGRPLAILLAAGTHLYFVKACSDQGLLERTPIAITSPGEQEFIGCAAIKGGGFAAAVSSFDVDEDVAPSRLLWYSQEGGDPSHSAQSHSAELPAELGDVLAMKPFGADAVALCGSNGRIATYSRGAGRLPTPPDLAPLPSPALSLDMLLNDGGRWTAVGCLNGSLCISLTKKDGRVQKQMSLSFDGPISAILLETSRHPRRSMASKEEEKVKEEEEEDGEEMVRITVGGAQGWVASCTIFGHNRGSGDGRTWSTVTRKVHRGLGEAVTALARADVTLDGELEVMAGTATGRLVALLAPATRRSQGPHRAPERQNHASLCALRSSQAECHLAGGASSAEDGGGRDGSSPGDIEREGGGASPGRAIAPELKTTMR